MEGGNNDLTELVFEELNETTALRFMEDLLATVALIRSHKANRLWLCSSLYQATNASTHVLAASVLAKGFVG